MVFSSLNFLFVFFPLVLIFYFLSPRRLRNLVLFVFSLAFYAWGEPFYVILMLFSISINYIFSIYIDKARGNPKTKKTLLVISVIVNLTLLGIFKYSDFLISNLNALSALRIPLLNLPLPIGISFYTFQAMSYTIDVYRGDTDIQKSYIAFGTYVMLFPQLVAGPIVQYKTIARELVSRKETFKDFSSGTWRFVTGFAKKVLLANNMDLLWRHISAMDKSQMSVLTSWIGILAFAFQIYFDFSGYSDMAIGLGRMFGFFFHENFNYPYISKSITEFWRRWHISLSSWFRDYVYIPLGGNRKGLSKQIRNILIVWLLTGIWHGASWNFVIWGLYYSILLIAEKLFLLKFLENKPAVFSHIYTMFFVLISWVIFAFDSFKAGFKYLSCMFFMADIPLYDKYSLFTLRENLLLLIILTMGCTPLSSKLASKFKARHPNSIILPNIILILLFIASTAYLVASKYSPFLYLRF